MLFKLRRLLPCWVGTVDFNVDLPDDDLVQVVVGVVSIVVLLCT